MKNGERIDRELYASMEAGRALDELVAKKVMGQRVEVPHYSTDIAAAWTVVEKMRDMWTEATDSWPRLGDPLFDQETLHPEAFPKPFDDSAFFDLLRRSTDRRWPWLFLYITPKAICCAALAALHIELPKDEEER